MAFKWIYLAFLALQFVLALGNRPKGERGLYATTLYVYSFLSIYLLVCSMALTVKSFLAIPDELKNDPNIRQFDGDYVQCNHCGKWLVQENWKIHIETRCSRLVRLSVLCSTLRVS